MGVELDKAKAVRKGEQLNEQGLQDYLRKRLKENGELNVQQFPSGFST